MKFPAHKCGLFLTHNEHRNSYEPLADYIADHEECEWESEEAKARAIASDECWTLQWYESTPVGFYSVAAPTLNEVLALAMRGREMQAQMPDRKNPTGERK